MGAVRTRLARASDAWRRFFFEEVSGSTLGVLRIAYGLVVLLYAVTLGPDLMAFYSQEGVLPVPPDRRLTWGLLNVATSDVAVVTLWVLLVVAAVLLTIGLVPRLANLVVLVALISFARRNPWVLNSGDLLLRNLAFLLLLAPSGVTLSVQRWLRERRVLTDHPEHAIWPLRLIQIQVSLGYLFAVWGKVAGSHWTDGTAVSYALRIGDLVRFPAPLLLTDPPVVVNLLTYGTLALEASLAVLIWNRRLRPWVLAAGVAMHLGIDLFIEVGVFSYAILVAYLAFVPPGRFDSLLRTWTRDPEPASAAG